MQDADSLKNLQQRIERLEQLIRANAELFRSPPAVTQRLEYVAEEDEWILVNLPPALEASHAEDQP